MRTARGGGAEGAMGKRGDEGMSDKQRERIAEIERVAGELAEACKSG